MRFTFTEEQRLLQTSALDWLSRNYDFRARAASVHRDGGSPAVWAAIAAVALLIVYFTMPWLIGKAAALLVGLVGVMTGLFLRKKRNN